MRTDQNFYLPIEAINFLKENKKKAEVCTCCKRSFSLVLKVIGHYYGMFDNEYDLFQHELKDGGYADEYLQAVPWSSGPCFFIGLRVYDKDDQLLKDYKWSQEEIDRC